jgi:hypothetical protein
MYKKQFVLPTFQRIIYFYNFDLRVHFGGQIYMETWRFKFNLQFMTFNFWPLWTRKWPLRFKYYLGINVFRVLSVLNDLRGQSNKMKKKMLALISRTNDVLCMLDVNMMVAKLRAMLKLFETDWQTYLFKNAKSDIRKVFLTFFCKQKNYFKIPRNGQTKLKMPTYDSI